MNILLKKGLLLLVLVGASHAVSPTEEELRDAKSWFAATFENDDAGPPFSFAYDGVPSRQILNTWELTRSERALDPQRTQFIWSFTDPSTSLTLACEAMVYSDCPAVEWVLRLRNDGARDTPVLSEVWPADFAIAQASKEAYTLYYADGSQAAPADFQPRETSLGPQTALTFSPQGGRSSDGVMPYFNLADAGGGGMFIAVGWTGQWFASFTGDSQGKVLFRAGMERTHLKLHPGEAIRTPALLAMHYSGDRLRGHNLWRRLMLLHYTPKQGNSPEGLPVAASGAAIGFNNVSEANQVEAVDHVAAAKLPVNTWWIDAGWSTGGFPKGMGTWEPDPARFPRGLRPVADAVHQAGLKFLVWFEPERVMPKSWLRKNHPEWLLAPSNLPEPLKYQTNWRLLDLGNAEARAWAVHTISGFIEKDGIDIYRQDFNMHPLYYWRSGEPPDRQGVREIHYIEGLYTFLDALTDQRPGLLIDNCASGGRRLDFEMMRRSVPLWRSDYCWGPAGAQSIEYGLSFWAPVHGLGAVSAEPYDFRSGMGTNATYAFNYYAKDDPSWPALAKRIHEYTQVRTYFFGDFYPLTPYTTADDAWIAWQFDRPDLGEGMVQVFRREKSATASETLVLHGLDGLDGESRYRITNVDLPNAEDHSGAELCDSGVTLTLEAAPSSAVLIYKRIGRP